MTGIELLAVGAHPDDVEVGCGGVLALSAAAGIVVGIADLSRGELSTRGTPTLRAQEARHAAELLGVTARVTLDLPDGAIGTDPRHREAVVDALRTMRPRTVLAPYPYEDRHPDHAAAGRLVREACFLAGVGRWGTGSPHRPTQLYHYMLHHPFAPTFVVDVTPVWEQRTNALAAYASQFGGSAGERRTAIDGPDFLDLLAARATVHGGLVGVARGEAYHCAGPVGLTGLPELTPRSGAPPMYRSVL